MLSCPFLVKICSNADFFFFFTMLSWFFCKKLKICIFFLLFLCIMGVSWQFFWAIFHLSCPFWSKFVKNSIFQTFLPLLSLFLQLLEGIFVSVLQASYRVNPLSLSKLLGSGLPHTVLVRISAHRLLRRHDCWSAMVPQQSATPHRTWHANSLSAEIHTKVG